MSLKRSLRLNLPHCEARFKIECVSLWGFDIAISCLGHKGSKNQSNRFTAAPVPKEILVLLVEAASRKSTIQPTMRGQEGGGGKYTKELP